MRSEIITIGDELLIGQVVNTNQAFIATQLNLLGIAVTRMHTVGDDREEILRGFQESWGRTDVVMVTGGLGPTHDDITKKMVCEFFHTDLVTDQGVREHIEHLFRARGRAWSAAAEEQSMIPRAATPLPNPLGTAPGLLVREPGKVFVVLPGVPYEMRAIMEGSVIPFLRDLVTGTVIRHRTLRTTGISESMLVDQLGDLDVLLQGARLAFLPSPTGVRLRITVHDTDAARADALVEGVERRIRDRVGKTVYGTGDEEIEEVVGRLLTHRRQSLAVAESCTGGLLANRITDVSGSSAYFERGVVAYSNIAKSTLLGVPDELIRTHGAVSREVAEAMAAGVMQTAGTDFGLSTTGIAGPTGATPEKPLGLVWIGYADADGVFAIRMQFGDERQRVKERATQAALELLRRRLLNIPLER
jgi:nicotinamide-nucleotide amidase